MVLIGVDIEGVGLAKVLIFLGFGDIGGDIGVLRWMFEKCGFLWDFV